MTLTDHFLGGRVDMLKLLRTARFLFGLLVVLSLLLLSPSPYRTMASSSFLDSTSADKADEDHGGSSPLGDADRQTKTMAAVPHLAMPTRQTKTMAAVPHLAMPMSPPLAPPLTTSSSPPSPAALTPSRPRFRITTT